MVNTTAIVVLLLYGIALGGVGLWASRRVRRAEDFYVASRRLGPGLLAAKVLAANIGSGTTVGVAGHAYDIGAGAVWWTGSAVLADAGDLKSLTRVGRQTLTRPVFQRHQGFRR